VAHTAPSDAPSGCCERLSAASTPAATTSMGYANALENEQFGQIALFRVGIHLMYAIMLDDIDVLRMTYTYCSTQLSWQANKQTNWSWG
jgi:hypothetical protein